ncbi:MAG: GatB/YqeY domain-containing protein [Paucibacter sp.]|nr:GatB/YqeY domain-containing protein [Roseateles sp.]
MSLKDRITEDMKTAMRAKEADKLTTIRGLLAAIKQKEVDERVVVDDLGVIAIVDKLIKQRKDSITQFTAGGRQDLADKEAIELKVLEIYLPQRMDAAEVKTAVDAIVLELGAKSAADMGRVMAAVKAQLSGKAEMALVSAAVKQALS